MDRDVLLKKNIFGGFDKKQVLEYITQLQDSCDDRKTKNEIEELRARVELLREILKERDREIASLSHQINDTAMGSFPAAGSSEYDILKRSAAKIDEARERAEEITDQISENIAGKGDNIAALFNKLTSINQTLTRLSGNLTGLSEQMEDVPFEPVTEKDVKPQIIPKFDTEKVAAAITDEQSELTAVPSEEADKPEEKTVEAPAEEDVKAASVTAGTNEDKLNVLFTQLVSMTEEINKVQSSISEKIDRIPEEIASVPAAEKTPEPEAEAEPIEEQTTDAAEKFEVSGVAPVVEINITDETEEPAEEPENIVEEEDLPPVERSIDVTSIAEDDAEDVIDKSADEEIEIDSADDFDDIFDNFEIETPEEDSIIKSAIESFKAQAVKHIPHTKSDVKETKPETTSEPKTVSEEPAEVEEKPVVAETKPAAESTDGKKSDDSGNGGFEESLYFTLDF